MITLRDLALGGVFVGKMREEYPYLGPNVLCASMLTISCIVVGIEAASSLVLLPFGYATWPLLEASFSDILNQLRRREFEQI